MNIIDNKLTKFISIKEQGKIPVFQRLYSWTEDDCTRLVDDIKKIGQSDSECHFIGSIIYVNEKTDAGVEIKNIIDGQQRLTTMSLLILALSDYCDEFYPSDSEEKQTNKQVINDYLFNNTTRPDLKYKLQFNDNAQNDDYRRLFEDRKDSLINKKGKFYINYDVIRNKLSQERIDPNVYILGIQKLRIVDIEVEPKLGDKAQLIFETVNGTGLNLKGSELIKNYILMTVLPNNQALLFQDVWRPMELELGKEFDKFFRYYLITVLKKEVNSDDKEYYKEFKKYADDKDTEKLVKEEIYKYYLCYKQWNDASRKSVDKLDIALFQLKNTRQHIITPVVLFLLKELNDIKDQLKLLGNEQQKRQLNKQIKEKEKETIKLLNILESYFVRFRLCEIDSKNIADSWLKILNALGKETSVNKLKETIKSFKNSNQAMPDDDMVIEKLKTNGLYRNYKWCRYILDRIENTLNKDYHHDNKWSVEHIMPQKIFTEQELLSRFKDKKARDKYDWASYLGDKWQETYNKYIDTIGNLTLSGYNSEYQNFIFDIKRDMGDKKGEEKMGYKYSTIRMTEPLKNFNKWSEKEILKREKMMASYVIKTWPYI